MPLYLIKNNFKLMFRNKWILALVIVGPILVIAVLSSAFEDMMKSYENNPEFIVGYRFTNESPLKHYIDVMKKEGEKAGIMFVEYASGDVQEVMDNNNCHSFVEFSQDSYTIYKLEEYKIEGMTTEYFLHQVFNNIEREESVDNKKKIPTIKLESMPDIKSKDYYGIIEIVYFTWCFFVSLAEIIASEKKYKILKKFLVSPVSDIGLYMAKIIPCVMATICEMGISAVISTILFDIKWGNIPYSILLLVLTAIAATFFGVFIIYLVNNIAAAVVVSFMFIWFMGFLGGTFETYLFSPLPGFVKNISPLYHINRSLVEYSTMGYSNYTRSCIIYLVAISVVFFMAGLMISKVRKGRNV